MNALTEEEAAMLQELVQAQAQAQAQADQDRGSLHCQGLQIAAQRQGPVLAVVDALLRPGRVTAILGPNGAGKSTLLATLCGTQAPQQGQLRWDGQALARLPATQRALRMAVMHQDTQLAFAFTVQEVVEMGRYPHRRSPVPDEAAIVQHCLRSTGVAALAQREMATLSGGERARVQLARALAQLHAPVGALAGSRWLLLDEPTAALDLQHQHQAMALVRARALQAGLGVVVVLHDLNLALRYADDVLLLPGQGAAAQLGPVREVLSLDCIARVWRMQGEFAVTSDGTPQFIAGACCSQRPQQDGLG
ncbi:MAG: heme ABC transporter ATP-binding protein [Acidovorax sp.]|nr:heme ABC transporter ATP-binding protein [Acidovorax sp.]